VNVVPMPLVTQRPGQGRLLPAALRGVRGSLAAIAFLVLASAGYAGHADAQGARLARPPDVGAWIDSIVTSAVPRNGPGCVVALWDQQAPAVVRAHGVADLARSEPIGARTPFHVASLSKQFTAMTIVLLAQDGVVSLDDDVRRWIPEVPDYGHVITLRHLLGHTSGLRDYYTLLGLSGWASDAAFSTRELLELVARQRGLNFAPGSSFVYSNTGYALLGVVVQRATGQSLGAVAQRRIFTPLAMDDTRFAENPVVHIPGRAIGYVPLGRGYRTSEPNLSVIGDGGLVTTIRDLERWHRNFTTAVVGGRAAIALLEQDGMLPDGRLTGYGLGQVLQTAGGVRSVSHAGAYGGFNSAYLRFPDEAVGVAVLCNVTAPAALLADRVASLLIRRAPVRAMADVGPVQAGSVRPSQGTGGGTALDRAIESLPTDDRIWMEGRYASDELGIVATLRFRDDALVLHRPSGEDIRFPRGSTPDVFTSAEQVVLRVTRDRLGTVRGFTLSIGRVRDVQFTRVF
jgi:CubicO group peptidase (beta-lactamase class C family)